jgi:hypothetical protein
MMLTKILGNFFKIGDGGRVTNGCASRLKHPLDTQIHLLFFDEFAAFNLFHAHLHLLFEPFVIREQAGDGFLQQFVSSPACAGSQVVKLRFLAFR